ncbi:glycoside hydrolase family 97 protein [Pontibacter silvestris]|uniref:Glycoside hydrolase family 97 protein n=1 Tax=Pontibacter silvestris TaxID=2305183 RepID=A0ABW4WSL2_9BACT|nr:glycoside hydrolase family 97 protein [Pontibacter silvestris]MCC9137815.1 glycoside hydrolase family 97 protein [Pontibacter silvestris]
MIYRLLLIVSFICYGYTSFAQQNSGASQTYTVQSPDGKIKATVVFKGQLTYTVTHETDVVIAPSPISMQLANGEALGVSPRLKNVKRNSVNQTFQTPVYKRSEVQDQYNELVINFKGDYSVIFRAYNDGVAYRFATSKKKDLIVENEEVTFNFNNDYTAIVPYVKQEEKTTIEQQFNNSFENSYIHKPISKLDSERLAFLPLVVEVANGKKVAITEADLESYPGLFLNNDPGKIALKGVFAAYPKRTEQGGHNQLQMLVKEREDFIAKAKGTRNFPWRVMVIAAHDKQLADSDMVYKLASASRVKDVSWVKPGKVAWDWWNDWNISGVDFKSGINNQTYKYYIDFASANNIEYVILDEGWAVNLKADLMQVVPEIDLEELIDYGKQKNVGIILWAGFHAFDRDMEKVSKHYADMGVKGFKVDFMDRDDQEVVDFYYRAAATGAKHKLLMDFHGAYKPTGLQRTYPNVINFEGVHGLEQMKWSGPEVDQVTYDVTMPYIRMLAGPVDYTQGAMRNASKDSYRPVNSEPMSQGTRTRQLAEYVVFESPLNMMADNPSNYMKEPESTKFIAAVPEVWDNTVALDGKIAEYIAIARQKGNEWYIGALTNWDARELELDLSCLGEGNYKAEVFRDGVNADRVASDYKREVIDVPQNRKLKIYMAPGGGYVTRIYRQ